MQVEVEGEVAEVRVLGELQVRIVLDDVVALRVNEYFQSIWPALSAEAPATSSLMIGRNIRSTDGAPLWEPPSRA